MVDTVHPTVPLPANTQEDPGPVVRMVKDGVQYDIPAKLQADAFSRGFKPEAGAMDTIAGIGQDLNLPVKIAEGLSGGGQQLGDVAKRYGQEVLIGKNGATYVMPAEVAKKALLDGLRKPNLADDDDRALVASAEARMDPANQGVRGAAKVAAGAARNEFVKTATFGAIDPEKDALTKEDRETWETEQKLHDIASKGGTAAGFAAGIVADPLSIGGAAGKVGSAVERRAMGAGVDAAGRGLGSRVLGGAIREGTAGAVVSAPSAVKHLLEGDPESAGEALLLGAGVGAVLGGGGELAGAAKRAIAERAGPVLRETARASEARVNRLDNLTNSKTPEEIVDYLNANPATGGEIAVEDLINAGTGAAKKSVTAAGSAVGGAIGGTFAGPAGAAVGYAGGKLMGGAVAGKLEDVLNSPASQRFITKSLGGFAKKLEQLGPTIDAMTTETGRVGKLGSLSAIDQLLGKDKPRTRAEQYEEMRDKLAKLSADTDYRSTAVGHLASAAGEGPHADAMNRAHNNALDYLSTEIPKEPQSPGLFQARDRWTPSQDQMARYERKVQVVMDPFSVLTELKNGTLTRDHTEALRTVWPQLAMQLRDGILRKAADPRVPQMTKAKRAQLSLLVGAPLDASSDPKAITFYQATYGQKDKSANDNGTARPMNVKNLAAAQMTPIQKQAAR